jgi:cytochrome P450
MIEAGSETTSATFNTGLLYLMANPSVVTRAHDELITTVGDHRSPTFADEENLPYIRAIVKEVLRVRPVASVGSPHYTDADVVYKDYLIPKGSVVTINQYGIHNDPKTFKNPESFDPARYLAYPSKSGAYVGQDDRDHWSFGAGRRICSGLHVAENSLFILFAKVLWAFDPRPPLDDNGSEIPIDTADSAFENASVTVAKPYRCRLIPRNDTVIVTIQREWDEAQKHGYWLGDRKVDVNGVVIDHRTS